MSDRPDRPPATWLLQNLERRLDALQVENAALAKDLRDEIRRSDSLRNDLAGTQERLREAREESRKRDERLDEIERRLRDDCLTRKDFAPYKNGVVALVTGVGMAMLAGVLKVLGWTK